MTDTGDAADDGALATGPLGMRLLGIAREPEDTAFADEPVGYVLVALWHAGRLLLVRERTRDCWELPGGGIDPGETPRVAAVRELWEESGQRVAPDALTFAGFARTALPDRRVLHGALYQAEATGVGDFTPNDEIADAHWWDPAGPPPPGGRLQTVDTYLALHIRT
ncbi:NUDIX domain-containing protein [Streptomyces sp. B6B3]|uniref:NUDIX domain-containing protein n=1 Tax=Streptomyces sp. B6B3 TaxID=3153570 RepID=UPI00325CC2F4